MGIFFFHLDRISDSATSEVNSDTNGNDDDSLDDGQLSGKEKIGNSQFLFRPLYSAPYYELGAFTSHEPHLKGVRIAACLLTSPRIIKHHCEPLRIIRVFTYK